jgi:hypothetical protein
MTHFFGSSHFVRSFMKRLDVSVANYQLWQKCVGFEVLILLPGCATY